MAWFAPRINDLEDDIVRRYWREAPDLTLWQDRNQLLRDYERVQWDLERSLGQMYLTPSPVFGDTSWNETLRQQRAAIRREREQQEQERKLEKLRRHLQDTIQWEYIEGGQVVSSGQATQCTCRYCDNGFETCSSCQSLRPIPKKSLSTDIASFPWDENKYLTDEDRTWLARMWAPTKNLPPGPWVTTELIR